MEEIKGFSISFSPASWISSRSSSIETFSISLSVRKREKSLLTEELPDLKEVEKGAVFLEVFSPFCF